VWAIRASTATRSLVRDASAGAPGADRQPAPVARGSCTRFRNISHRWYPMLSPSVLVGTVHHSFFVGTCPATVLFPMCVRGSVVLPRALKSEDENRRRHPEIAQRLERQVRSNIPTRMMGGFCTLEGLSMTAAKTGYVGMIPGGNVLGSIGTAPSLPSRLSGSAWARQDCPRYARRCAVLTRPARSLEISYYRSDALSDGCASYPRPAWIPVCREVISRSSS
jgi:hypothetical protein